jgi:PPOX class probable F420-dependent enzyme
MPSGSVDRLTELPLEIKEVIASERRAVLTTADGEGRPHAVPVVFAIHDDHVLTPIDRKPKTTRSLGRRKNIEQNPHVALLIDRWSEEWTGLAWVMIRGTASVQPASESTEEIETIIARYRQYRDTIEGSEIIRIVPWRISWWSWS